MFFVGLNKETAEIEKWLDGYFNYDDKEFRYAVILAKSGNGKTFFSDYLSHLFKTTIFHITPFDIQSSEDINNTIKSLNLSNIFETRERKIIYVDDFDLFHWSYRPKLLELPKDTQPSNPLFQIGISYSLLSRTETN